MLSHHLLCLIFITCFSSAALAQDINSEANQALFLEYEQINARLEKAETSTLALKDKIQQSSGNDKTSLEIRQFDYAVEMLKQLSALTNNIDAQEKAGIDTSQILKVISPKMLSYGPLIRDFINRTEANFNAIKPQLEDDSTAYILALSKQLNHIDTALAALFNHVKNLNTLHLNNQHSTNYMQDELLRRAELLTGQLQLLAQTRDALQQKLQQNEKDQALINQLNFVLDQTELITASLRHTTKLMTKAGLDSTTYKSSMIESTGHISTDILNYKVLKKLLNHKFDDVQTMIKTDGIEFLFRCAIFVAIMLGFWLLSAITHLILRLSFDRSSSGSYLMKHMMLVIISRSIIGIGFLVALSQLGVSLLPVLTGLGIAGFVIGFALQDTLGNFASGMMILIYRPYDVGDTVQAGSVFGCVSSMNLVSTTIMTIDNQTLIIPNTKIWGDVITNVTDQKTRRIDMKFNLPLESDVDESLNFFKQLIKQQPAILNEPEPLIELNAIHNHALEFIVKPWVNTEDYWSTYWAINAEVKRQLDKKGIQLPVQQHKIILQDKG
ncbi:MAG: mechanosensitive ion channel [Pseudomonadales bacterium]|nr:mechanosensitive ion channel [Pseudomonadales bacterium]